jgi:hypothetical protein
MNALQFSDNLKDLTAIKLSELEKNNFSNMKMLKSIYDDSFDVANDFFRGGAEGFKSSPKKAFEQTKTAAKKADKNAKASAKKVNEAKKKVDAAKKDADKTVEDAKQDVEDAEKDADEANEEANEANEAVENAEEVAVVAEGDEEDKDEEFANYNDSDSDSENEGFDNGSIEGMKSKKKSSKKSSKNKGSKYPETIPSPDLIGWAVQKAQGTKNDETMVKNILNSLFVTFLSFLIAHNWYYTFFVNPTKFRFEDTFSFLSENDFTHFFTIYIVQIVTTIETFIMESIPGKFNFVMENTPFGKRSIFFFILSASLASVPYFLKQVKSIFEYLRNQINRLIDVIRNYNKSPVGLRNYIHDIISKFFNSILLFKGNAQLSSLIGIIFVMKYMKNVIVDHSKGFIENATEVIPSFFTKLLSGTIFYIIFLVFKFAMFYQPTIAFSSFIITAYMFYFSIVRLPKINGIGGAFIAVSENNKHMNDGRVLFKLDVFSKFQNGIEDALRFIMQNSHQIIILFTLKSNIGRIINVESKTFKTLLLTGGIAGVFKLLYSVLEKYGIGNSEVKELSNEFQELSKEIQENIEKTDLKKIPNAETMFERIYKPYKSV